MVTNTRTYPWRRRASSTTPRARNRLSIHRRTTWASPSPATTMTTTCSSISQPCETLPERYRERERRGRDGDRRRHRTAARRRRRTTDAPHVRITRASRALNLYSHARLVSQHPRLCLFRATLRSVVVVAYKNLASSMNESRFSRFSNSRRSRHTRARASPKPAPRLGTAWRRIYSIVSSRFGRRSRVERRRARASSIGQRWRDCA